MSQAQHSIPSNPMAHPDSSSQLPPGSHVNFPHPQPGGGGDRGRGFPRGGGGFPRPPPMGGGSNAPPPPGPGDGDGGNGGMPHPGVGGSHPVPFGTRGPGKAKFPRQGQSHTFGFPFFHSAGREPSFRGLLDNRFVLDRQRFGLTRFRSELSAEERIRFLAAIRGCPGCNFRLLQFIYGIQYFPEFAHLGLCKGRPTSCGIWIIGVNGCWFRISADEASVIAAFGGPAPITIPCGPGFGQIGFGPNFGFRPTGFIGFGRGFPAHRNSLPFSLEFGGVHPSDRGDPRFGGPPLFPGGPGGPDDEHLRGGIGSPGDSAGTQGQGIDGREHPQPGS